MNSHLTVVISINSLVLAEMCCSTCILMAPKSIEQILCKFLSEAPRTVKNRKDF